VKSVIVVSLLLGLTSYAGTVAGTQIHDATPPTEGYVPPADQKSQSDVQAVGETETKPQDFLPMANPEKVSCEAAYKRAVDSGVVADANNAAEVCNLAVQLSCRTAKKTGDARLNAAVCRLDAAHAAYLKVKN